MQQENIEYLSGEVREILASPPSWVATLGTGILVAVAVLIGLAGVIFHYPEIVTGEVTLTTETPPVLVYSQKSEYILALNAADNSEVSAGDLLAVFPSDADYKDVIQLEKDMETVGQLDLEKLRSYNPNRNLKIGELSQSYSSFVTAFELVPLNESGEIDYATVVAVDNINAQYQRQLKAQEASLPSMVVELRALESELKNASSQYAKSIDTTEMVIILSINSSIAKKKADIKKVEAKVEEIKGEISKSNMRKLQAQTQAESGTGEAIFQLNQKLDALKKDIKAWKDKYLVLAPGDGKIQFYTDLKAGQPVNVGDVLFTIMPKDNGEKYIGKVKLPVDRSGKVKENQVVNIKFGRYPFREFGTVRAKVSKVYPVAKDNAFYADILIENGLVTSLNRKLDFYQQMSGKAEIVTNDQSFFSKLFEKF